MVLNGPKWLKMAENGKNGEKWSMWSKRVKMVKNCQNGQKWSKL